jgi:hypothetical protein
MVGSQLPPIVVPRRPHPTAGLLQVAEAQLTTSSSTPDASYRKSGLYTVDDDDDDLFETVEPSINGRKPAGEPRASRRSHSQHRNGPHGVVSALKDRIKQLHSEQADIVKRHLERHTIDGRVFDLQGKRALHVATLASRSLASSVHEKAMAQSRVLHDECVTEAQTALLREVKRERVQWHCLQKR